MDVCRDVFRVVLELSDGKGASTICFIAAMTFVTAKNQYQRLTAKSNDTSMVASQILASDKDKLSDVVGEVETISVLKVYYLDGYPVSLDVNENFTMKDICTELFHDFKVGLYEVEREIGPMQEHKLLPAEMTVGELISRWKAKHWPDAKLVVPIYLKDWSSKINHKDVRQVRFENSYLTASPSSSRRNSPNASRNSSPSRLQREQDDRSRSTNSSPERSISPNNMGSAARARTHAFFSTLFVTRDDMDPRENSTTVTEMSWENSLRRNTPSRRLNFRAPTQISNSSTTSPAAATATAAETTAARTGASPAEQHAISTENAPAAVDSNSPAAASPQSATVSPVIAAAEQPSLLAQQPTLRESNSTYGHSNSMVNAPLVPVESPTVGSAAASTVGAPSPQHRPIATLFLPQTVSTSTVHDYNSPLSDRWPMRTPPSSTHSNSASGEKVRPRTTYVHLATEPHTSRTSSPAHSFIAPAIDLASASPVTTATASAAAASPVSSAVDMAILRKQSPSQSESPGTTGNLAVAASSSVVARTSPSAGTIAVSDQEIQVARVRTNSILNRLFKLIEEDHHAEIMDDSATTAPGAPGSGEKAAPTAEDTAHAGTCEGDRQGDTRLGDRQAAQGDLSPLSTGTMSRSTSPATSVNTLNTLNTLNSGLESVSPGGTRRKRKLLRSPSKPIVRPPFDTSTSTPTMSHFLSLPIASKLPAAVAGADGENSQCDDESGVVNTTKETVRTPIMTKKKSFLTPASFHTPTRTTIRKADEESVASANSSSARVLRKGSASKLSTTEASLLSNNNMSFSSALRAAGRVRKSTVTPTGTPSATKSKEHPNATPTLKSVRSMISAPVTSPPFVTTVRSVSAHEPIGSIGASKDAAVVLKRFRSPGGGSVSGNSRTASPYSTASATSRDAHHAHNYAQHHPAVEEGGSAANVSHVHDAQRHLFEEQQRQNRARSTSPHSAVSNHSGVSATSGASGVSGHSRPAGNRRGSVQQPGRWVP